LGKEEDGIMGIGTIVVLSKNGKPLPDQKVTIEWNWAGHSQGTGTATTNNLGEAVFAGNPAFSKGAGRVTGPLGQHANFEVGTNWVGDFDKKQVQVTWNPVESAGQTIGKIGQSIATGIVQFLIIISVIAVIGVVIYKTVGSTPLGKITSMFQKVKNR
jgi:hypothetical protein